MGGEVPLPFVLFSLFRTLFRPMPRNAEIKRQTAETNITLRLELDGTGTSQVQTGVGFFDHMLTLLAKHGLFDLTVDAQGTCMSITTIRSRMSASASASAGPRAGRQAAASPATAR
ncbi:MAG: hypothetical protein U0992_13210 [Planctomycetaceae bacterium]